MKKELMDTHKSLIKQGKFFIAKNILELLIEKQITLIGYSDNVFYTEKILESKLKPCYSRNCNKVTFYLN